MNTATVCSDVVIVGAGITGLSTSLNLAERGASVTLVERYQPAAMASGWTLAGVRQSGRDPAELPMAKRAVTLWKSLDEQLQATTGYRQSGNLRLARNDDEARVIQTLVDSQLEAGLDIELLDATRLQAHAPALSPSIVCASLCASDGQADPIATSKAYRSAAERLGVRILTQTSVNAINVEHGRFHSLQTTSGAIHAQDCLLATGIQTNDLLHRSRRTLPIEWALVAVMKSAPLPPLLVPVIGVANADLALRQQADGCLRMTSGAEFTQASLVENQGMPEVHPAHETLNATLDRIRMVLPSAGDMPITEHWGGLLDMTPDGLPVIDRIPGIDGLYVAAGFSGHGFGIGPAVGESLAQLILQGKSVIALDAFRFNRFGVDTRSTPQLHG